MFDQELIGFEWTDDRNPGHTLRRNTMYALAPLVAAGAIATVAGSVIGAFNSGSGQKYPEAKVLPKTVSGGQMQDFDVLYDVNAINNMWNMSDELSDMAAKDRAFFDDVYLPFQQRMAEMNQAILPAVESTSKEALEAITSTLVSGQALSDIMTKKAETGLGDAARGAVQTFRDRLNDLPSESERVGQALTNVEGAFSAAGKQLSRDYQSRGQTVTQASQRDLAMEKAKAKAGAAGLAAEASRAERLNAAERGAGLELQVEQIEAGYRQQAGQMATAIGGLAQNAAGAAQQAIRQIDPITGLETKQLQAGIGSTLSQQQFGTRARTDTIEHTQKGIKEAQLSAGSGAPPVYAGGGVSAGGGTAQAGPVRADGSGVGAGVGGSSQDTNLQMGGGGAGTGGFQPVPGGKFDDTGKGVPQMATGMGVGKTIGFYGDRFHVQDDGNIVNLQTGQYLDKDLSGDDASKYDTKKFIKMLSKKAKETKGSSGITTEMKGSITDAKQRRAAERLRSEGGR